MSRLKASQTVQWPKTALKRVAAGLFSYCLLTSTAYAACTPDNLCDDDLSAVLAAEEAVLQHKETASQGAGLGAGISISIDGETVVGTPGRDDANRQADIDLEAVDIQVKFDGLGVERSLSVSTAEDARIHTPDALVEFTGHWNYPDWIERAEVRIHPAPGLRRTSGNAQPVAVVPMDREGNASWLPGPGSKGDHFYVLRVYDAQGRFDETEPLPLVVSDDPLRLPGMMLRGEQTGRGMIPERPASPLPAHGTNQLARAGIPVHGGMVTVYGKQVQQGLAVRVMEREVPVTGDGDFVVQRILPAGEHVVGVSVYEEKGERSIEFERGINIPDSEWFYVGLADLTVGRRTGDDSALLAPAKPGEYDPVYRKGRLAFYLKGKVRGRYIITAALDTNEEDLDTLFSNMDRKDPRQLLRRLDPDDYYPVYGDDSLIKEDAPTSGKFYARVDRGRSHVMWGNFKTRIEGVELARYERGLYGAKANLETEAATVYGDPVARLQGFAAQPGTLPQRDQFKGTGGSVYFLKRSDINQGSEQITIEIRDASSGLVVDRKLLREGEGYTIDYVQGVLILAEPLSSTTIGASSVLPSSLASYEQFVVATYEYTPTFDEVDGYSYGGRAEAWLMDSWRFGVTGYQENTGPADQTLVAADATWRLSEKSYFQLEWAQSQGDTFAEVSSTDGGFIFNPVTGTGAGGTAEAWRAGVHLDLGELTLGGMEGSIGAVYEQRDKGFNAPGRYTVTDERILDAHLELRPSEALTLTGRFDQVERSDGVMRRDASAEAKVRLNEQVSVQGGILHSDSESGAELHDGVGERTDAGGRITWHGSGEDEIYVFGQGTVARDSTRERNDRIGAGFKADIAENLRAEAQLSYGTSGIGLLGALTWEPTSGDKYYVGYRLVPDSIGGNLVSYDPFGRDNGTLITGIRRQVSDSMTAWTEHNFDMMGTSQGLVQAYGVEFRPDSFWTVSSGVEIGTVEDEASGSFERIAPSIAATFKDQGKNFGARLEARFEDSNGEVRDRVTWLGQANMGLQYDDDWRFLAKIDAVISQSDQSATLDGDYIEASVGWAYRPVASDRFNALFKYTYLHDLPGAQQVNSDDVIAGPKQRSHVLSADFIYDLTERLSVGAKYGLRMGEISTSRDDDDFVPSTAHLGIVRADYHVVKNWDILLEARALWLEELEQVHYGVLAGIYRHIGNNLKVGVGYNFGRFSDDLTDLTLDDEGIFVNVVGKF
ncbi:hypothetical protein [Salaquimonas pukyongi]|uniref:hypothetical protein n=1 Tax=Salaquimonas pukyongi TaxID=2712698 RepID=UPI00096B6A76|nr:hypothetical protein [Salaquimonas pukyongi]